MTEKRAQKEKTDRLDRVLIALALLSAAAGMVCAVYYYDIYPVFHAADAVIIASFCVLAAVLCGEYFPPYCAYELGQVPCRGADTGGCCDSAGCGFVFCVQQCGQMDRGERL